MSINEKKFMSLKMTRRLNNEENDNFFENNIWYLVGSAGAIIIILVIIIIVVCRKIYLANRKYKIEIEKISFSRSRGESFFPEISF